MPFESKKQMAGAFGGYLGPEMQAKAPQWASETPNPKSLPLYANGSSKGKSYRVLRHKKNRPA